MVSISCGQTFKREKLGLKRDQDGMRRNHRIDRQQIKRWRAVDENIVEGEIVDRRLTKCVVEQKTALFVRHQFDIRRGKIGCRRAKRQVGDARRANDIRKICVFDQQIVGGQSARCRFCAKAGGCIALRVYVDQKHALARFGKSRRKVDRGSGLPDPAPFDW